MSNFRKKHAYGAIVGGFNFEVKTDSKNIADQLNHIKSNFDKYLERSINRLVDEDSTELNQKNALKAAAARWFFTWMFLTFRVKTFIKTLSSNPNGNRSGEDLYREYIRNDSKISAFEPALYDQERLAIFDEGLKNGEIVGGLSFWRIFQHTYSVLKEIQKDLGDIAIHVSHQDKITEKYVVKMAKQMNERKLAETEAKENDNDAIVEDVAGEAPGELTPEMLLEQLENREISASDIADIAVLEEMQALASGAVRGGITRRINTLVEA